MAIEGNEQPEVIRIDESLRLRKFDGIYDFALEWYQDLETVWLVDGDNVPYDAAPEYRIPVGMKFYHGSDDAIAYDDMGETAMDMIGMFWQTMKPDRICALYGTESAKNNKINRGLA